MKMARKGMGKGKGKGYKNMLGVDKKIHSMSAKGIKQPQKIRTMALKQGAMLVEETIETPFKTEIKLALRKPTRTEFVEQQKRSFFIKEALKGMVNLTAQQQKHMAEVLKTMNAEEQKLYLKLMKRLEKVSSSKEFKSVLKDFTPELKKIGAGSLAVPLMFAFPQFAYHIGGAGFLALGSGATGLTHKVSDFFDQYIKEYKKIQKDLPDLPLEDVRHLASKTASLVVTQKHLREAKR